MNTEDQNINALLVLRALVHKYRFIIIAISSCIIGIILLLFGKYGQLKEIFTSIGVALLTAGTVGLAVEHFTRKQFRELIGEKLKEVLAKSSIHNEVSDIAKLIKLGEEYNKLGIVKIEPNRKNCNCNDLILRAPKNTEICLMGICLRGFADAESHLLFQDKINEGCSIKMLTLNPESRLVQAREKDEKRDPGSVKSDIIATISLHCSFISRGDLENFRDRIGIHYYDSSPNYFILITELTAVVGFYLRDNLGELFPHMVLENKSGGIYQHFKNYFDSAWNEHVDSDACSVPTHGTPN